jgi:hypothetical protein
LLQAEAATLIRLKICIATIWFLRSCIIYISRFKLHHPICPLSSLAQLSGNRSPQKERLGQSSIPLGDRITMAGLFKRVYDWLLRLFWSVCCCPGDLVCAFVRISFLVLSCCNGTMMLTVLS